MTADGLSPPHSNPAPEMPASPSSVAPVQVVTELLAAMCEERIDDMLARVDPLVTCLPVSRPGRSLYHGHAGMVDMIADLRAAYGRYHLDLRDIAADSEASPHDAADVRVRVRGRIVPERDGAIAARRLISSVFTVRGGLVRSMESELIEPSRSAEAAARHDHLGGRSGLDNLPIIPVVLVGCHHLSLPAETG